MNAPRTKAAADSPKPVLAIAIEDRVDMLYHFPKGPNGHLPAPEMPAGCNYFDQVHADLVQLFAQLVDRVGGSPVRLFNAIASTVVSIPGVVEGNRTLLQLPLWHSPSQDPVRWHLKGRERENFDFAEELTSIAEACVSAAGECWTEEERARFLATVFVVNDATATAAFEYAKRGHPNYEFVFLKLHNGVNVGFVRRSERNARAFTVNVNHPEAGHSYPVPHEYDAQFPGVCARHGWCFEGMLAVHSIYQRAASRIPAFTSWSRILGQLKGAEPPGQELDDALHRSILKNGDDAKARDLMIDIVAHYAAQLVYQIAIGPLTPQKIVIGGRTAQPDVIEAIRAKVFAFACGYPRRRELSEDGIMDFIQRTEATAEERKIIEAKGALEIALSRAAERKTKKRVPSPPELAAGSNVVELRSHPLTQERNRAKVERPTPPR